jgi:hypothetical protein
MLCGNADETNHHWLLHCPGTQQDTPKDKTTRDKFHEDMIAIYKEALGNSGYAAAMAVPRAESRDETGYHPKI